MYQPVEFAKLRERVEREKRMSETINCSKCGQLLYFGEEIKRRLYMRAIPNEEAVLSAYGNSCPRCSASLSVETVSIQLKGRVTYGS
jgi:ribosomal protein L34E